MRAGDVRAGVHWVGMVRRDAEWLDVIIALAGRGRGLAGQIRLWSAIVLVGAVVLAAFGGFAFWGGSPTTVAAARIENGYRPRVIFHRTFKPDERYAYRITGHLADADSVVFMKQGAPWRCAPLVSGRAGADRTPARLLRRARDGLSPRPRRESIRRRPGPRLRNFARRRRGSLRCACRRLLAVRRRVDAQVAGGRAVAADHRGRRVGSIALIAFLGLAAAAAGIVSPRQGRTMVGHVQPVQPGSARCHLRAGGGWQAGGLGGSACGARSSWC